VEFRQNSRRPDATHCWDCARPRSNGFVYANVKEHLKKRLVLREGGCCQDCGATADVVGEPLHAHHIEPQALGGANTLENLKLVCPDCHVGSGWMRHHFGLVEAGLVVPPVAHQAPQLALVA
jgi:5-methylcytosine-specific restriction endonuclease McrA